jgi:hypothetical protein
MNSVLLMMENPFTMYLYSIFRNCNHPVTLIAFNTIVFTPINLKVDVLASLHCTIGQFPNRDKPKKKATRDLA